MEAREAAEAQRRADAMSGAGGMLAACAVCGGGASCA